MLIIMIYQVLIEGKITCHYKGVFQGKGLMLNGV
jgi:hypothetical protein